MEELKKTCVDGETLLAFAAGSLGGAESASIEKHVETCSRCRQVVRENEEIARFYLSGRLVEPVHPSSAELTGWVEGLLDAPVQATIRDHLDRCVECREIVLVLEKVQIEIESPGLRQRLKDVRAGLETRWRTVKLGLPSWVLSPVPAYLLVLLMVYPAYVGVSGRGGQEDRFERLAIPTLLSPPTTLDSPAERGPKGPRIVVDRRERRTVLTFFVPIAPDRYRYQVELRRGGTTVFSVPDAESFDGIGTFVLYLPEGSLEPGDYELHVKEVDRQRSTTSSAASFPFSIGR